MKQYLFVYGTLKKGYGNHFLLENSQFICNHVIKGDLTQQPYYGFPTAYPGDNQIHGEIYAVNLDTIRRCDMLEGHPHLFKRTLTKTIDYEYDVMVYFYQGVNNGKLIETGVWE